MNHRSSCRGITLLEVLITLSIVAVTGAILLSAMNAIAVNSAKNSAINLAHQQVRQSIHRVVEEIRESASLPILLDADLNMLPNNNGPAAGVSYQIVVAGPYRIFNNANANSKNLRVFREREKGSERDDDVTEAMNRIAMKSPYLRLIVPAFQIEEDVASVQGYSAHSASTVHDVTLKQKLGIDITCTQGTPVYPAYFTQRSAIVLKNGELRHYRNLPTREYAVVARNLVGDKPFSAPNGDKRFVQFDLTARDSRISNRGYKAVDLRLNLKVPIRYQLTSKQ